MTFSDDLIPDPQVWCKFGISAIKSPAAMAGAQGAETDKLAGKSDLDGSDARALAQRRLAFKLAADAGLSMALAEVLVGIALGDGRPS